MEKSKTRFFYSPLFLRKKETINETKAKLDKYCGDSAPLISLAKCGLLIFVVVVEALKMLNFLDGQLSSSAPSLATRPVEVFDA